jgi:hypothetical protein
MPNTNSYLNMILTLYAVLGYYLFKASFNPTADKGLIGFATWGSLFGHGAIMVPAALTDMTPVYAGPVSLTPYVGEIPATMFGLTQYAHLFVDIPFLAMMWAIHLFFMAKCF